MNFVSLISVKPYALAHCTYHSNSRLAARFRKPLDVTGEAVIKSICWTTDIDYFLHMNNAKYLKELDFARFDYYFRTGLWELFKTYPGTVTNAFVFFT